MNSTTVESCFRSPTASELDSRFADTVFVVEADSFAKYALWKFYGQSGCVQWKDDACGLAATLGYIDGRPVVVKFSWAELNGRRVLFYDATSEVVDHKIIDKWLEANCNPKWDSATRRAKVDANNFHHCISVVQDLSLPSFSRDR